MDSSDIEVTFDVQYYSANQKYNASYEVSKCANQMQRANQPNITSQDIQGGPWGSWLLRIEIQETLFIFDIFHKFRSLQIAGVVEVVSEIEAKSKHTGTVVEYFLAILPLTEIDVHSCQQYERWLK